MLKFTSAALILLTFGPSSIDGFTATGSNRLTSYRNVQSQTVSSPSIKSRSNFALNASEEETEGAGDEIEAVTEEVEEVVEEVDEELEAIKKTIAELEGKLKNKNRELDSIEKMGEQYTQGGYARKVAEMEQFRKTRSAASADNKVVARAAVLQNFLPVVDELNVLTAKYGEDEFAAKYGALSWDFMGALKDLGVSEYATAEGDFADTRRVTAVEEEHSETIPAGCIISPLGNGFEIDGNIMRMAAAVVSLGPEGAQEEEAAAEATAENGDE